jgi:hypothetical protein
MEKLGNGTAIRTNLHVNTFSRRKQGGSTASNEYCGDFHA